MKKFSGIRGAPLEHKVEVTAAILIALSTVCSAWGVYEATRWSSTQFTEQADANAFRAESVRESNRAFFQMQVDVQLFTQWVNAVSDNDTEHSSFLRERFRPEFLPALEGWLNQTPEDVIPAGTPFDLPEYVLASQQESERLLYQALNSTQASQRANQLNDNYILTTVLFASVLFSAGIQSKVKNVELRKWLLIVATGVFALGIAVMFSLPVNFGY